MEKSSAIVLQPHKVQKANQAQGRNPDKCSLEAVGICKNATDKEDKYQIYKMNNTQFNDDPDNMFKTI